MPRTKKRYKHHVDEAVDYGVPREVINMTRDLTVTVPRSLADDLDTLLAKHGTDLNTLVRLHPHAYAWNHRRSIPLGLDDAMTFSKYAGLRVEDVIRVHPDYAAFLVEKSICAFDAEATQLRNELLTKK